MKALLTLFSFLIVASPVLAVEGADRSGTFKCACDSNYCLNGSEFKLTYDRDRQWIELDGERWTFSGYVSRQMSRSTGTVYLMMPKSYSLAQDVVIKVEENGEVDVNGQDLACSRLE